MNTELNQEKQTLKPLGNVPSPPSKFKHYLTALIIIGLLWASAYKTDATFQELLTGLPEMGVLMDQMLPPDWAYFEPIIEPMLETIRMAVLGTTFGAILAIPLSLLAASNVVKSKILFYPTRMFLNLIRTIPDLLKAAIFVAIFGLGAIPGILALTFFSLGLISKLLYETIEAIDKGPLEAMTAVGANKIQWIFFGIVPQISAHFMSYTLYTFEVNIRAAAVLGLVGAGGIGHYYEKTLGFLQYDRVASIIIFTLVIVLIIDYTSTKIREKLL
ncbi:phosphonate ABC transporter, permease protein PhnE [Fictibacillus halophilus]|uniref:phosphonate ABC transporter, permease protein PhnE n=1 Tax=Fictibacillus halophilus TaxID=1610490 RepID=UPI003625AB95